MTKNNLFRLTTAAWILIFAAVGNSYAQEREVPKRWKEVNICGLSFLVPKKLKSKNARGIDSCVAEFRSKNISLGMDFGAYTATPEDSPDYQNSTAKTLEVDGKKATLSIFGYQSRLYVLIGKSDFGTHALGMLISGRNTNDLEIARQIFQSIRFVKEKK